MIKTHKAKDKEHNETKNTLHDWQQYLSGVVTRVNKPEGEGGR